MAHILKPERLVLWCCPNSALHEGERIIISDTDGVETRYFVVRMDHHAFGKVMSYMMPPVDFSVVLLSRMRLVNPTGIVGVGHKKCAECEGFEDPGYWRKKYKHKEDV